MSALRLQVLLARAGVGSRRACEELIAEGLVTVNGERATLGQKVEPTDHVKVRGRRVGVAEATRTIVLHVPRGVVTTASDPEGRTTVLDLVRGVRERLHPVGRLDLQTTGLLLLTNDGELTQLLTHPSSGLARTYRVKVRGLPDAKALGRLGRGLVLDGRRAQPLAVRVTRRLENASWLEVVAHEGRHHLVRDALAAVGHPVAKLHRLALGPLRLGRLAPGTWRDLTGAEVAALRRAARASGEAGGARVAAQKSAASARAAQETPPARSGRRRPAGKGASSRRGPGATQVPPGKSASSRGGGKGPQGKGGSSPRGPGARKGPPEKAASSRGGGTGPEGKDASSSGGGSGRAKAPRDAGQRSGTGRPGRPRKATGPAGNGKGRPRRGPRKRS